ncbi:MAG: Gfo/Idh/MocA family oxidoreductase [Candidatus Aminicenantes bacterium]|nr:MAG: Gfo/Idh/MocA family oxidoreductase [Candidatus Aminicenantes bacterium]
MSSQKKLKVGIIGFGKKGILHASLANINPKAEWKAACDSDEQTLSLMKIFYPNIAFFSDIVEMLEKVDLNTIFICTPDSTHLPLVTRLIEKDMNIFVENPLADSFTSAKQMVNLASHKKNVFSLGYYSPFKVLFQKAKALFESGNLDKVKRYRASMHYTLPPASRNYESLVANRTSSFLHLIYWLFGPVKSLYAKAFGRFASGRRGSFLILDHSSDLMGLVDLSWNRPGFQKPAVKISLEGTGGTLDISEDMLKLYLYKKRGEFNKGWTTMYRIDLPSPSKFYLCEEGYFEGNSSFLKSCSNKKKSTVSWEEGLEIMRMIEAIDLSIDSNTEISLSEVK